MKEVIDMEDVKNTLKPLEWSTTVRKISSENTKFPVIVKPTPATASEYEIREGDPVLLHHIWVTQRMIAQNLEDEGAYVFGPQMEIPSEYTGTFQYRRDQKGNDDVVRSFSSVKEIASVMPDIVFPQERLVIYPVISGQDYSAPDKVRTVVMQAREQLTVLEKKDILTISSSNRIFGGKPKFKQVPIPCVTFRNEVTKELINVPLTTKGKFSTKSFLPVQGRELDFQEVLSTIDLPINLTTCRNCPRSPLDEHVLRPNNRLRVTNIEEHEVIIGVTLQQKIIEFAISCVEFILPKHLDGLEDKEQEIVYQTALQRFLMECQIKNSPVNIKDYKKSVRNHISRSVRPTTPKALSQIASSRVFRYTGRMSAVRNGLSAIQLLVHSSDSKRSSVRRSSLPLDAPAPTAGQARPQPARHAAPLPAPPDVVEDKIPPLPPRNVGPGGPGMVVRHSSNSPRRTKSARAVSYAGEFWNEFPTRPPPPPPTDSIKSSSSSSVTTENDDSIPTPLNAKEMVWESFDETCLRKLRQEREKKEGRLTTPYENFDYLHQQPSTSSHVENTTNPGITLDITRDQIEGRSCSSDEMGSLSPEFSLTPELTGPEIPMRPLATYSEDGNSPITNTQPNFIVHVSESDIHEGTDQRPPSYTNVTISSFVAKNAVSLAEANNGEEDEKSQEDTEIYIPMSSPVAVRKQTVNIVRMESLSSTSSSSTSGGVSDTRDPSPTRSKESSSPSSSAQDTDRSPPQARKDGFHITQYSVVSDDSSGHHVSLACNYVASPTNWTPPDDLGSMSVSEVANSLRFIGMNEDTVDWFQAEKVDGHLLCSIEKETLSQHFRLSPFQHQKLVMFLKGWRPKLE